MDIRASCFLISLFCFLAILSLAFSVMGDDFMLSPMIRVNERYNDNIYFDPSAAKNYSDMISTVVPSLILRERTERVDLDLNARLSSIYYRDYKELNATDRFLSSDLMYRLSERSDISLNGGWSQDSQPDRDLLTTGLILRNYERTISRYSATFDHALTEISTLQTSIGHEQDTFNNSSLVDTSSNMLNVGISQGAYDLFGKTTFSAAGSFQSISYEKSSIDRSDIASAYLGIQNQTAESLRSELSLGAQFSRSRFKGLSYYFFSIPARYERYHALFAQALIENHDEYNTYSLSLLNDINTVSGSADLSTRTSLNASWDRRCTEDLSLGINAQYFLNRIKNSGVQSGTTKEKTFIINPHVRYRIESSWEAAALYEYVRTANETDNTIYRRNILSLGITYRYDYKP